MCRQQCNRAAFDNARFDIPDLGGLLPVGEPKLQIDERCDRIEAALGALADELSRGDLVRTVLYGGGESRGEGDMTPSELHVAHNVAMAHHEAYLRLAMRYNYTPTSPVTWDAMPDDQKNLLVGVMADMLDNGVIKV